MSRYMLLHCLAVLIHKTFGKWRISNVVRLFGIGQEVAAGLDYGSVLAPPKKRRLLKPTKE